MLRADVLSHPYGLAYYNGYIYWSEFQNGTIKRVSLDDQNSPKELRIENPYIFDLKVFSNKSQSGRFLVLGYCIFLTQIFFFLMWYKG